MPSSRRLLIVDDDPQVRTLLEHWLESREWTIETAWDAVRALIAARERPPFLIISDVNMLPAASGTDFLSAIRSDAALAKVPVILLTGEKLEKVLPKVAPNDQRVRLISKPPDFSQIRAIIKDLTGIDGGPLIEREE